MTYAPGEEPIVVVTNAPEAYDYGATVIDSTDIPGHTSFRDMNHERPFRSVRMIPDDGGYYARYQQDRYRSGGYLVLTPTAWLGWIEDGFIILPEAEPTP